MTTIRLFVYVNPHSGTKKALRVYQNKLESELKNRENAPTVIFTEFSGHCMNHVKNLDLTSPIHIVTLSGDGLIFEVLNGLYQREDWSDVRENVWLGVVPCGTGNALACSIAKRRNQPYATDFGLRLALQDFLKGSKTQTLDLMEIELQKEKIKVLSFIGVTIGLIADADIGTEWIRCMGHMRAYLMVAWRILKPKSYRARVSYLPLKKDPKTGRPIPVPQGSLLSMPSLEDPNLPEDWITESENYYLIYADNLPLLDSLTLFVPQCELDDGILYLVIVRVGMSRRNMLKWLLNAPSGISEPHVDIIPVRAFRIEPIKPEGHLTIDGEGFQFGPVQGQILPGHGKLLTQ